MIAGSPARIVSVSLPTCRQPFDRAARAAVTEPGSVAHGASARRTWLRGIHHLFERGLVDDVVVHESCLDQAFRNVEVTGGGMDIVLARLVGVDVRPKVVEWAEEPLGVCDQADRKASLLPVSSRNRKA